MFSWMVGKHRCWWEPKSLYYSTLNNKNNFKNCRFERCSKTPMLSITTMFSLNRQSSSTLPRLKSLHMHLIPAKLAAASFCPTTTTALCCVFNLEFSIICNSPYTGGIQLLPQYFERELWNLKQRTFYATAARTLQHWCPVPNCLITYFPNARRNFLQTLT